MQHFLDIDDLTRDKALLLIERALELKKKYHAKQFNAWQRYPDISVLNIFYEKSTRTRLSFELAAKRLGCSVLNLDPLHSSNSKGEILSDLLQTVAAMGVNIAIIRHAQDNVFETIQHQIPKTLHLVNAGCGARAHPTQALLDMMTIVEQGQEAAQLKIAVVGDILHSRVAHSFMQLSALMGVGELVFCAPSAWLPTRLTYGRVTEDLTDALSNADIVMTLRVQKERLLAEESVDLEHYRADYAITENTLLKAKPSTFVMHPGPMNRGVEIDSEVADGKQSLVLSQVENGVFMRMAILEMLRDTPQDMR